MMCIMCSVENPRALELVLLGNFAGWEYSMRRGKRRLASSRQGSPLVPFVWAALLEDAGQILNPDF